MPAKSDPTAAEMVAAVLSGSGQTSGRAVLVPLSTRVPSFLVARLDAMAAKSGKSRNSLVALVLEAGLESISSHLDERTKKELRKLEAEAYSDLPEGADGETF